MNQISEVCRTINIEKIFCDKDEDPRWHGGKDGKGSNFLAYKQDKLGELE
jgi:hypothetical protein